MAYNTETHLYEGFIYKIANIKNSKIYIGQTCTTIEKRWKQHLNANNKKTKYNLYKAMESIGVENFYITQVEKICCESDIELSKQLDIKEKYYISVFNTIYPYGYNMTTGGKDVVGTLVLVKPVDAYYLDGTFDRTYSSIKEAEIHMRGRTYCSHIGLCCRGKVQSSMKRIWRYHGEPLDKYPIKSNIENDNRGYPQGVKQYTTDGTLINVFGSQASALRHLNIKKYNSGYVDTPITLCCSGKLRTAYGYVWRYINDDFDKFPIENQKKRKIKQFTTNGVLLKVYDSLASASSETEISDGSICDCCKGNRKTTGGYVWRYYEDDFDTYETDNRMPLKEFVNVYDMNNNYINSYKYFDDLKQYFLSIQIKVTIGGVNQCCNHRIKSHRNYRFYHASDPTQPDKSKIIPNKKNTQEREVS